MTLRIQKSVESEFVVFRLIGRIQGDQVPALRALFKSEVPGQNVALDLKEVKLVDRDAVRFLAQVEAEGRDPVAATLKAGFTRFRPVLMTALAMIIGMVPMAMGLGDVGEQNAPLGRAVIGGLLFATVSTLFFVPTFFSLLHGWRRIAASAE